MGNNGTWYNFNGAKYYQGSMTNCKSAWVWAELTFRGNRVTYITEKTQGSSLINVYIYGEFVDTVDIYGGNGLSQTVVFDTADFP